MAKQKWMIVIVNTSLSWLTLKYHWSWWPTVFFDIANKQYLQSSKSGTDWYTYFLPCNKNFAFIIQIQKLFKHIFINILQHQKSLPRYITSVFSLKFVPAIFQYFTKKRQFKNFCLTEKAPFVLEMFTFLQFPHFLLFPLSAITEFIG